MSAPAAVIGFLGTLLTAAAAAAPPLATRRHATQPAAPVPAAGADSRDLARLEYERSTLIHVCEWARANTTSKALANRLATALGQAGAAAHAFPAARASGVDGVDTTAHRSNSHE